MRQSTELLTIESVRNAIGKLIPKGQATLVQTAEVMGFSARTLQRRLAEQGLSFSHLVDEMRFIKAQELIQQQEKIAEVATRLGYADTGSFTRAFERWTGVSPTQYRKRFLSNGTKNSYSIKNKYPLINSEIPEDLLRMKYVIVTNIS